MSHPFRYISEKNEVKGGGRGVNLSNSYFTTHYFSLFEKTPKLFCTLKIRKIHLISNLFQGYLNFYIFKENVTDSQNKRSFILVNIAKSIHLTQIAFYKNSLTNLYAFWFKQFKTLICFTKLLSIFFTISSCIY